MSEISKIKKNMDVVCSCGARLGKVDHLDGDRIMLTKNEPISGGVHRYIPVEWVDHVDSEVILNINLEDADREITEVLQVV